MKVCVCVRQTQGYSIRTPESLKIGGSFSASLMLICNRAGAAHLGEFPVGFPGGRKQLRTLASPKV